MRDFIFDDYQNLVSQSVVKHKSILDILSKLHESEARINRSVVKAVTTCGCVKINGEKQKFSIECDDEYIQKLHEHLKSHLSGSLCDECIKVVEQEIGNHMFYISALCNTLDISMYDVLIDDVKKLDVLGKFSYL